MHYCFQEPNNLTNKSSFRYSGIVQRKTVGVTPAADKKGFVVSLKKVKGQRKPAKLYNEVKMRQPGFRRPLKKLRNILTKNNYRKDLTKVGYAYLFDKKMDKYYICNPIRRNRFQITQ